MKRILLGILLAGAPACSGDYTRHTVAEVESVLATERVVGAVADSVIAKLKRVRLANGDTLQVGGYVDDDGRRVVEAGLANAKREKGLVWAINVVVSFDSTRIATESKVEMVAVNAP